jgi:Domain of Unknown Function (DUF1080)
MRMTAYLTVAALMLSASVIAQENTLSDQEKKDGWKLLYDGKSTDGWHRYGKKGQGSGAWKGDSGSLRLETGQKSGYQTKDGGDVITDDQFTNFDLKLEWQISKNGNSGIMICVNEDPQYKESWNTGPEIQVLDNDGHSDGKIPKHRAANLYDLIAASSEPVKPVGDWNQVEIKLDNGKLDIFLNSVNVVSTTMWTDAWWALVKGSKFKDMPGFSKYKTGHVALQDHGNSVWYRNIKIRALP